MSSPKDNTPIVCINCGYHEINNRGEGCRGKSTGPCADYLEHIEEPPECDENGCRL